MMEYHARDSLCASFSLTAPEVVFPKQPRVVLFPPLAWQAQLLLLQPAILLQA